MIPFLTKDEFKTSVNKKIITDIRILEKNPISRID